MLSYRAAVSRTALCCLACTLLGQGLAALIAGAIAAASPANYALAIGASSVVQYAIGLATLLAIRRFVFPLLCPYPVKNVPICLGDFAGIFALSIGVSYFLNFATALILQGVQYLTKMESNNLLNGAISAMPTWLIFLLMCICAPIMEELMYRKALYPCLAAYGEKAYLIVSALIFALAHLNLYQIPYAFVLGVILAYLYAKTGSILLPMALHCCINFVGSIVSLYAAQTMMGLGLFCLFLMACAGMGIAFLLRMRTRLTLAISMMEAPPYWLRQSLCNVGMLLLLGLSLVATLAMNFGQGAG